MKKPCPVGVLALLMCMTVAAAASAEPPDSPLASAEVFKALADDHRRLPIDEVRRALDPEFSRQIGVFSRDLASLGDEEVRALMSAAYTAVFYTKRLTYLAPQIAAFDVLKDRNAIIENDVQTLQRGYILARDFQQASALYRRYPSHELQVIPPVEASEGGSVPNALILTPDKTLKPVEVDLGSGDRLIALVHPNCAFSRRAMVDLTSDLGAAHTWETVWAIPFDPNVFTDAIHEWQQTHGEVRFHIPTRFEDWSFLQRAEIPVFYRIKDGEVVGEVVGWPAEGNMAALHQLFEP